MSYWAAIAGANVESSVTLIGSIGSVKIAGQYMNEVVHCNVENYTMPELAASNPPNDYSPHKGSPANHCYAIENVVKTLNGQSAPTTIVEEGIEVVDTIERIYKLRPNGLFGCSKTLIYNPK